MIRLKLPKPVQADSERHKIAGWVFMIFLFASLFSAVTGYFAWFNDRDVVSGGLTFAAMMLALWLFHRAKYNWPKFVLVLLLAVIAAFYKENAAAEQTFLILFLPSIVATLVVDRTRQVASTAVVVAALVVYRGASSGGGINLEAFTIYTVGVTCLVLARYLLENRSKILQRLYEELKEKNELKTKFVTVISHETQTPLTELRVSAELLDGEIDSGNAVQQKLVDTIIASSTEIGRRINGMFMLLEAQENGIKLDTKTAKLRDLLDSILITHSDAIKLKKLKLKQHIADLEPLQIDIEKMRLAIDGVLDNAINYTAENGEIDIRLQLKDGAQLLTVRDTGVGIPETEQASIFDSFNRASNAFLVSPDGEGVGLAIAKYMVEAHGGSMGFTSTEGKGSSFWIRLSQPRS